jgi:hypothetical protein
MKTYSFLKYFINTIIFIVSLCVISNANAGSTYFGIDALYSNTRLKRAFGGNVFSRRMAPGVNFSLGHMFNNYFGAEVGFEIDDRNSDVIYVPGNEDVFGVKPNNQFLIYSIYQSKINQNHSYISLKANFNVFNNFSISSLLGSSLSNFKIKTILLSDHENYGFGHTIINRNFTSIFNKTKMIFFAKLNLNFKLENRYNINLFSAWKNTSNIQIKSHESTINNPEIIKFKNFINIGIGLYYYF